VKFQAHDLLDDSDKPCLSVISEDSTLEEVLNLMLDHDFSQVPVCQSEAGADVKRTDVMGMVTRASCLETMRQFSSLGVRALQLSDVIIKAAYVRRDDQIEDVLRRLQDESSVLIHDDQDIVCGIITHADTTRYFRQHAEDVMRVRLVEDALKEILLLAFNDNREAISSAVGKLPDKAPFFKALADYLGPDGGEVDRAKANEAFCANFTRSRDFDAMTLGDFVGVLTAKKSWSLFQPLFGDETRRKAIVELLNGVRETRNALAHFRDFSESSRETLRFAADWIDRHFDRASRAFGTDEADEVIHDSHGLRALGGPAAGQAATAGEGGAEDEVEDEELDSAEDTPFVRLTVHLRALPRTQRTIVVSFAEIERILSNPLPRNARKYRSWWANSVIQPQARQWLDADWRVNRVNMSAETVCFGRIEARERQYIDFFSRMTQELRARENPDWLAPASPRGSSWNSFARALWGKETIGRFSVAFGFENRVRAELYIDSGDSARNDQVYTRLKEVVEPVSDFIWSPIEGKRACRVHMEREGNISMEEEKLNDLREQLSNDLVKLINTFSPVLLELAGGQGEQ